MAVVINKTTNHPGDDRLQLYHSSAERYAGAEA